MASFGLVPSGPRPIDSFLRRARLDSSPHLYQVTVLPFITCESLTSTNQGYEYLIDVLAVLQFVNNFNTVNQLTSVNGLHKRVFRFLNDMRHDHIICNFKTYRSNETPQALEV